VKAFSAATEYTNEERGGGRDPGVRRPGVGRGQFPARSKMSIFFVLSFSHLDLHFFAGCESVSMHK